MGRDPALGGAALGFCLLGPAGEVLVESGGARAVVPASTLKTVTTATALEWFGPGHVLETVFRATAGAGEDGGLAGDLVVVGGGDPALGRADLDRVASALFGAGLRRVTGRVFADARLFGDGLVSEYWNWGDVGNGYGAGVSGLNFERNEFVARFRAGPEEGAPAVFLGCDPELPGVVWRNRATTGAAGEDDSLVVFGGPFAREITFAGALPLGADQFPLHGAIPDPPRACAEAFRAALRRAGVACDGLVVTSRELGDTGGVLPDAPVELYRHRSPPLLDLVRHIHAESDNRDAQCLFLLLGVEAGLPPEEAVRRHWAGRGLDLAGARIEDGSGLARANHITPLDLAKLNYLCRHGPHGEAFYGSLEPHRNGRVRWKGGAMSSVRGYVGFATAADGQELTFAFHANHYPDSAAVRRWRERLLDHLVVLH
jgi:D-alanyl-D-alanine carboxypeptidase/D-alanyl-D-alanine-endopeptidase (penicillin-binding protein 4)